MEHKTIIDKIIETLELLHSASKYDATNNEYSRGIDESLSAVRAFRELEDFKDIALELMRYMARKHHPHTTAIITSEDAELLEGIECVSNQIRSKT